VSREQRQRGTAKNVSLLDHVLRDVPRQEPPDKVTDGDEGNVDADIGVALRKPHLSQVIDGSQTAPTPDCE